MLYNKLYEALKICHSDKSKIKQQAMANDLWKAAKVNKGEQFSTSIDRTIAEHGISAKKDIRSFLIRGKKVSSSVPVKVTLSIPTGVLTEHNVPSVSVSANSDSQSIIPAAVGPTLSLLTVITPKAPVQARLLASLNVELN